MPWKNSKITTPITNEISHALKPVSDFIIAADPVLTALSASLKLAKPFVTNTEDLVAKLIGELADEMEAMVRDLFGTGVYVITIGPFDVENKVKALNIVRKKEKSTVIKEATKVPIYNDNKEIIGYEITKLNALSTVEKWAVYWDETTNEVVNGVNQVNLTSIRKEFDTKDEADIFISKLRVGQYDSIGVPLLPTHVAIQAAIDSLDDLGDASRPQFSEHAYISAIGLMATAPSLGELLDLMRKLLDVFEIPDWKFSLGEFTEYQSQHYASQKPDWKSLSLNSFEPMNDIQNALLDMIYILRGYQTVADTNLEDLIEILDDKVNTLQETLRSINDILNSIKNCTGIYTMNLPKSLGGNERLKQAILDPSLQSVCGLYKNKYTYLTLIVGGESSLEPVENLRKLLLGEK